MKFKKYVPVYIQMQNKKSKMGYLYKDDLIRLLLTKTILTIVTIQSLNYPIGLSITIFLNWVLR